MTQTDLEKLLAKWQRLLRLQDWNIQVRFVRGHEIDDCQARIKHNDNYKCAIVKLRDPQDWPPGDWPEDSESDLVHELLHLHMSPFDGSKADTQEAVCLEQAIECITQALVKVERTVGKGAE